ncbi:MAG: adenylate/guanylate cyclase domain-containing protein [Nitrosomonadales bacterium]|nr:adenylate/guanylate cyclase domain-containing protein [Nitrosomonadales bacterium]
MTTSALQENAAVLFADISGSTALYEELGDELALQLVTRTLGILTQEMTGHQGTLVKTMGDEIMCTFPDAVTAFNAACEMQEAVEKQRPGGDLPIHVRIGLHYGEVLHKNGDVYGDTVNIAAKVTAITRARQIMTTHTVVKSLSDELRKKTRPVMRTVFRGKTKAFDVFHVHWERERSPDARIGRPTYRKPAESRQELMLRYRDRVVTLNEQSQYAVLGRGENCDLIINNSLASRQHARIEYSFGKNLLADSSKNGTFVQFADGTVIRLKNQQIMLHGAGFISLGQPFSKNPTEVIEFLMQ